MIKTQFCIFPAKLSNFQLNRAVYSAISMKKFLHLLSIGRFVSTSYVVHTKGQPAIVAGNKSTTIDKMMQNLSLYVSRKVVEL